MSISDHYTSINLTEDQQQALKQIENFLEGEKSVFILKGYAGSGKTTLLKGLVSYLSEIDKKPILMAPTGRAAKVVQQKTGYHATTIHKAIYSFDDLEEIKTDLEGGTGSFQYHFKIWNNPEIQNSVLIIDEASMVSDILSQGEFFRFGSGYLLKDLFTYSRLDNPATKTKIIFIGDPAQLPPIGMNDSPALSEEYVKKEYGFEAESSEIREVKRQDADNGIFHASSKIRKSLTSGFYTDFDLGENGKDIFNPAFEDFLSTYKAQESTKIIITYKNKTALDLNQRIRQEVHGFHQHIQSGDVIIIGSNNYRLGILNGEFGVVSTSCKQTESRTVSFKKKGGGTETVTLTWRLIELQMPDEKGDSKAVKGYMLDNFLDGDTYLTPLEQRALYIDFRKRHPKLAPKTEEFKEAIISDLYFNCILLKYGYAVTCHKAQGGEWDRAFVFWDKAVASQFNFVKSEHNESGKTNPDFYRWAYTAVTRASKTLYCINPPNFNAFSKMSFIDTKTQNSVQQLSKQSIVPVEIDFTTDHENMLLKHGIQNVPLSIQDHFLRLYYLTNKQYIEIIHWERKNYEIRYYFKRESETAAFIFWVNAQDVFKDKTQKLPAATNSIKLFELIESKIANHVPIIIRRITSTTVLQKIEFEIDLVEKKPFLNNLYEYINNILETSDIQLEEIEHHNFRERYRFVRGSEHAIIDFEYNGDGFFGRVLPIENQCNSDGLILEIRQLLKTIISTNHAF